MPPVLTTDVPLPRVRLLLQQEAWVAEDEMNHYLLILANSKQATQVPVCALPRCAMDEEIQTILHRWADSCCRALQMHTRVVSALLIDDHWLPAFFHSTPFGIKVATSRECGEWIDVALASIPNVVTVSKLSMARFFPNDCGFQSVAWLSHMMYVTEWPTEDLSMRAFRPADAVVWRSLFEHFLRTADDGTKVVVPMHIRFGGTGGVDVASQLAQLLRERGVPADQATSRADLAIEKIGRGKIANVLRGPQPWKDLKAAANALSPKVQLVLNAELQAVIQQRLQSGPSLGHKRAKRASSKPPPQPVTVLPQDINIPPGIFREGNDVALNQIRPDEIASEARGVVVVHVKDAVPYLKMSKPVSSKGLALVVLDHNSELLTGVGEVVRFPALCVHTSEPMLMTAKLVQIGSIAVSRNLAPTAPKIEVVDNAVLRALVYKDEWTQCPWSEFIQAPVKQLFRFTPALQTNDNILDCWDRQWLTLKMARARAPDSDVFVVSLRVTGINCEELMLTSGNGGCYFEPRAVDGRQPAADYKVVWLNRTDKPTASVARQSTKTWTCLVRAGLRYGLRCRVAEAEQVHDQHKPNQPFLEGQLLGFHVGPFPWGATRQTIAKAFKTWQWAAKPSQPKGRSADGVGVIWEVFAAQPHVFSMEHSDILISPMPPRPAKTAEPTAAVQGSARTLAALRASQSTEKEVDPWLNQDDPWSKWTPGSQSKRQHVAVADQTEVLSTQIEKRVLQVVQAQLTSQQHDTAMDDDSRLTDLEHRMQTLEQSVTLHQQQQQQHNSEVANQMTGMQSFFDRKLNEQMGRIEALLMSKRE